jgi:hypothetical protein
MVDETKVSWKPIAIAILFGLILIGVGVLPTEAGYYSMGTILIVCMIVISWVVFTNRLAQKKKLEKN